MSSCHEVAHKQHANKYVRSWKAADQHVILEVMCLHTVTLCLPEPDQAHSAAHAGFVYMRLLPERGGATQPAFQYCFGNRAPTLANGRAGIMTCVFVRVSQTAVSIW